MPRAGYSICPKIRFFVGMSDFVLHQFHPQVAEVYGIEASLIFSYIWHRSKAQANGWVEFTLEDLCEQYPYMGRYQVWSALQRLTVRGKETPNIVFRKKVAGAYVYKPAVTDLFDKYTIFHKLEVNMAVEFGIVPAIIFNNIAYWIKENWRTKADYAYMMLDPEKFDYDEDALQAYAWKHTRRAAGHWGTIESWQKLHPYVSHRTARRGFDVLQKAGFLTQQRVRKRKPLWRFSDKHLKTFEQYMLDISRLENCEANSKRSEAKIERSASKTKRFEAKTKQESGLNNCAKETSGRVNEANVNEAANASRSLESSAKQDSARPASRARATGVLASPFVKADFQQMNRPNLPSRKVRKKLDCFGEEAKRGYTRIPDPQSPEYDEWLEALPNDQRPRSLCG